MAVFEAIVRLPGGRLFPWGHRTRERAVGRRSAGGLEITFVSHMHGGMGV